MWKYVWYYLNKKICYLNTPTKHRFYHNYQNGFLKSILYVSEENVFEGKEINLVCDNIWVFVLVTRGVSELSVCLSF